MEPRAAIGAWQLSIALAEELYYRGFVESVGVLAVSWPLREAGAALQHVDGIHEARLRQLRELQAPGRVVGLPATGVVVLEAPPGVAGALQLAREGRRGEALRQLLRERGGELLGRAAVDGSEELRDRRAGVRRRAAEQLV